MELHVVPRDRPHDAEIAWALFSLLLLGTGLVKAYAPEFANRIIPGCFLKEHLGLRCPTCGTGTSLMLLARGDITGALRANFLAPLMIAALALFDAYLVGTFVVRRRLEVSLTRREALVVLVTGLGLLAASWTYQLLLRP